MAHLGQDLRYALRLSGRAPGLTGLLILMLALGMGANVATFSVADALLLRMLPVKDPGMLFRTVRANADANEIAGDGVSYLLYQEMRKRTEGLADLAAYQSADFAPVAIGGNEPTRVMQQTISGNYFQVLGVRPAAGRMIAPSDEKNPVAVISYRLWSDRFERSGHAIGSKLEFGGQAFDIMGVAPDSFFGVEVGKMVDVWTPIATAPAQNLTDGQLFWLRILGRLHPGVSVARASAPIEALMNEAMMDDVRQHAPPGTPPEVIQGFLAGMRIKGVLAGAGTSPLRREYRQPLEIMMFVVGLVFLIACTNVASLLMAQGRSRLPEMAIRLSLGAGRGRILQQLMTESFLLAVVSAGAALLLAHWATPILVWLLAPSSEPAALATGIDLRLVAFAAALSLLTVVISGLVPALQLAPADMDAAVKRGASLTGARCGMAGRTFVASQVALSFMLVVGALLFTRTLMNLSSSPLGFDSRRIVVAGIDLQHTGDSKEVLPAWNELLRQVRAIPGVEHASLSSAGLFTGEPALLGVRTTETKALPVDPITGTLFVSDAYFQTMGIPLRMGRDFEGRDDESSSPMVALVNEAFVRKFFGKENAIGRKLTKMANSPVWTEIVGVVADAKFASLREPAPPMMYLPYGRMAEWVPPQGHLGESMVLEERGHQTTASLAAELRREAGKRFAVGAVSAQEQIIGDTLVRERLLAEVASVFGGLAFMLTAFGLYGLVRYGVVQRRRELGIRMALGAVPASIVALMLREWALIVGLGLGAGIVGAALSSRLMRTLLFGLGPDDPTTFSAATGLMMAVSLVAAFLPAYKAAKTDPVDSLRHY